MHVSKLVQVEHFNLRQLLIELIAQGKCDAPKVITMYPLMVYSIYFRSIPHYCIINKATTEGHQAH